MSFFSRLTSSNQTQPQPQPQSQPQPVVAPPPPQVTTSPVAQGPPGAWSQTQDNTGDNSWLKQGLLNVIAGYNKMIKARTASKKAYAYASTKASNMWNRQNNAVPEIESGAEKRKTVILNALRSLESMPNIENVGVLTASSNALNTTKSKMSSFWGSKPQTQGGKLRKRKHKNKNKTVKKR